MTDPLLKMLRLMINRNAGSTLPFSLKKDAINKWVDNLFNYGTGATKNKVPSDEL